MRGKTADEANHGKNRPTSAKDEAGAPRRRKQHVVTPADWGGVNSELLREAVAAVTQHGAAIRFGYTRDLGAYAVGFYEDGDSNTEYIPPSEDINMWLVGVVEDYGK